MVDIVKTTKKRKSSSTKVTLSSLTTSSAVEGATTEFTLFPKLPIELRLKIWKLAASPRLVGIGARKVPGIFHACVESRKESEYHFRNQMNENNIKQLGMIMNYKLDILYVKRFEECEPLCILLPYYALRSEWPQLLKPVQRLALNLKESGLLSRLADDQRNLLWDALKETCPDLVELIVILRNGPLSADIDDLYEINEVPVHVRWFADPVLSTLRDAQEKGHWKDLKLTFMRSETWER